ncbi:hypothetical protein [Actinomadura flavalba]|uniref:hypothetical protein n=1 Tax=Actinomadura flavalba TaxID=1120938 RepID=UPI0012DE4207|nr:hypothetical protein [Actinomadura flavalba]
MQVAGWINETEAERSQLEARLQEAPQTHAVNADAIHAALKKTDELARAVVRAHPNDKADLYRELGLTMTYHPDKKLVEAKVNPASTCTDGVCPRGDLNPHAP